MYFVIAMSWTISRHYRHPTLFRLSFFLFFFIFFYFYSPLYPGTDIRYGWYLLYDALCMRPTAVSRLIRGSIHPRLLAGGTILFGTIRRESNYRRAYDDSRRLGL